MAKRRYAVIGCGAVGGLYGGLLQKNGHEVHFLLHGDYEHVRDNGLVVESVFGDFILPSVNACDRAESMPPCDVVLIAIKATENRLLCDMLPHLAPAGAAVVLLQNGLGGEELVSAIVPGRAVLGGLCFLCSTKTGPGHIRHVDYGRIRLGHFRADRTPAGRTPAVNAVSDDLCAAGVPVEPVDDLYRARWEKLVWNIPYNGLCALTDLDTGRLMADASMRTVIEGLMNEVLDGAAACGKSIDRSFVGAMLEATDAMVPYAPSMQLDRRRKRPMELEAIFGIPLKESLAAGAQLPRIRMLHALLRMCEDAAVITKERP